MSIRNLLVATAALTALAGAAQASGTGSAVTENATAHAKIIAPITISKQRDLEFGTILRPTSATPATITLAATSGATTSAGSGAFATGSSQTAPFDVTGGAAYTVSAAFSGDIATLSPTALLSATTGTANQTIYVGGSFNVSNATAANDYTGTVTLTVQYD
jgi:spore coat protein U-like protein